MYKHHLLMTFRNFKKFRGSFLINLSGLSIGLACTLLIFLWVNDELHFDKFHQKDSRLYQVMELSKENDNLIVHEATQGLLAEALKRDLPEVESSVPIMNLQKEGLLFNVTSNDKTLKSAGIFAGKDLFTIFSFNLIHGNPAQVLADKNAMVISAKLAKALFGSVEKAIGKNIEWELYGTKKGASVSGVFSNLPVNSSMQFDFALPYEMFINDVWTNGKQWNNEGPSTYLLLKKGTGIARFNTKIKDFIQQYSKGTIFTLFTRPYSSAYLHGNYENGVQSGGRVEYVTLFSLVALFILVIACINFMNLSTARASRRMKEVGIKKVVGSTRKSLIIQFLSEAIFVTFLSLLVACIIVSLFLPVFNQITGKQLSLHPDANLTLLLVSATVVTGLLSGSYPAFYLSRFNPVDVLKGRPKNSAGELLARKGLVIFQFVVSLVLIVSVMVVYKQMEYVQTKNLGYDKSNIISFDKEGAVMENMQPFLIELKRLPGVVNASAIQQTIVQTGNNAATYDINWPGKPDKALINFVVRNVDYDMLETLGIQVKEGRSFSKNFGAEDTKLIFNETAINVMNLTNPVGKPVRMWEKDMTIAGVVKDFHISSLHEPIAPMVFRYDPKRTAMIMAKLQAGKEKETISRLQQLYKKFNPGYPFEYKFLDEAYQAQYVAEQRVSLLSRYFAGLAILISCLGLFGLAAFNAEVRTKEIGIRKVLGASISGVMLMLSKDFLKLVVIAVVIAFPLAWWAMHNWLNGFAYKTDISVSIFMAAFVSVVLITVITVSFHALKAAVANPVKSLRTE